MYQRTSVPKLFELCPVPRLSDLDIGNKAKDKLEYQHTSTRDPVCCCHEALTFQSVFVARAERHGTATFPRLLSRVSETTKMKNTGWSSRFRPVHRIYTSWGNGPFDGNFEHAIKSSSSDSPGRRRFRPHVRGIGRRQQNPAVSMAGT